ncbi:LEA type 2 family protein [Aquimarina sp. U1-2]|uniref:NDR1/HIN1-like protein n=1 Tax=Aquimarina sp. U1-2 TaxID=2823141 RepID=UPI001AECAD5C|nr:LEA type 2 family protein [Aquimarina sp. U1-2]MBP2831248.1 LEA type 2 family protein [Aquimarina sp. U1-2]
MFKWIAGGLATFFAGRYLLRLNKAAETITSRISIVLHKVALSGLELKAIVRLQNPNPIALNLQYPFVKITYKGNTLGTTEVRNEIIHLPENSEQNFELKIQSSGWLSLIQILGTEIVTRIRSGENIVLNITATTTSRINNIPYEQVDQIQLSI